MVTVLVLFALLAPLVSPVLGTDLWGWLPQHGHVGAGSMSEHVHPWDSTLDAMPTEASVRFTAGDLLGAPVVPVAVAVLIAIPLLIGTLVPVARGVSWHAGHVFPDPPPPR